jgi:hypothetical protein
MHLDIQYTIAVPTIYCYKKENASSIWLFKALFEHVVEVWLYLPADLADSYRN